jgi:pimeloyl-ACP methyl ester carboxylesterase
MEPGGWYELGPDHRVLVTSAPEAGDLRLLDFDSVRFQALRLDPDSGYVWKPADSLPERRVVFLRGSDGGVTGFRWRDERGAEGVAPRAGDAPFDAQEVRFRGTDSIMLAGLVMVPRVRKYVGPVGRRLREVPVMLPGAVVIHGSGTSDRDNVWAFHIAQHLARNGVVVLFPDKRGSGASAGDWRTADFGDLAADALAGVDLLRGHPAIDPERIGLVGLSQGGWIAPLAAGMDRDVAYVINVSGAAVNPAEQVRHEVTQDLRAADLSAHEIEEVLALVGLADAYSRTLADQEWEAYAARLDSLLESPIALAVEPFPASRDHWHWSWWHEILDFDPIPLWESLDRPALTVYGGEDERDNVPVAASVRALRAALEPERRPEREIRVFPGSGHALTDSTGWIDADFLALLSRWIAEHVGEEVDRSAGR